jgi:Lrp/AsnC family leucine-responsive transcriptional regulator
MSYTDLGRDTGLSVSAVHQRVRRLERRGVIVNYTVTLNYALIGVPLSAFIALTSSASTDADLAALRAMPAIVACHTITGTATHLLHARLADLPALEALLHDLRTSIGGSLRTALVLATCFERPPRPRSPRTGPGGPLSRPIDDQ